MVNEALVKMMGELAMMYRKRNADIRMDGRKPYAK